MSGADSTGERLAEPENRLLSRSSDWVWRLLRRIHLGTAKPDNWIQLFKFGLVGGSGYVVNLLVFALLTGPTAPCTTSRPRSAPSASRSPTTSSGTAIWTFSARHGHAGFQAARFITVSVVGLAVNLAILELLISAAGLGELPAQALAVALAMPVNFIGNKLWTFA